MLNKKLGTVVLAAILATTASVRADSVLIIGDGDVANTEAAKTVLLNNGHTSVTIDSITLDNFDGTGLLAYTAVVLLDDNGGVGYDIPTAGQNALVDFVNNGGGLITSEWINWSSADHNGNSDLEPLLPMKPNIHYSGVSSITYSQTTLDPTLDAGLPNSFTFATDYDGGVEDLYQGKPGAIPFFSSDDLGAEGVLGWDYSSGRVISFSTLISAENTDNEITDPNYSRLFSNSVFWAEKLTPPPVPLPASSYAGTALMAALLVIRQLRPRRIV